MDFLGAVCILEEAGAGDAVFCEDMAGVGGAWAEGVEGEGSLGVGWSWSLGGVWALRLGFGLCYTP